MKGQVLIDRIRDEMAAAKNDYVSMMGELMTAYLRIHPDTEIDGAMKLDGAFNALREAARKKQKGGCYAMPPREVFDRMLEYYKIPHADADYAACMAAVIGQSAPDRPEPMSAAAPEPTEDDLIDLLDIDALLGV